MLRRRAGKHGNWKGVGKKEERMPDWMINQAGSSDQMHAVTENGDKYLEGPLYET